MIINKNTKSKNKGTAGAVKHKLKTAVLNRIQKSLVTFLGLGNKYTPVTTSLHTSDITIKAIPTQSTGIQAVFQRFSDQLQQVITTDGKPLGKGCYGSVKAADIHTADGEVKSAIIKSSLKAEDQQDEIDAAKLLHKNDLQSHDNIGVVLGVATKSNDVMRKGDVVMERYKKDLSQHNHLDYEMGFARDTNPFIKKIQNNKLLNRAKDIANAVDALLKKGIRHNDAHEGNFMTDQDSNLRMIDFGMLTQTKIGSEATLGLVDYNKQMLQTEKFFKNKGYNLSDEELLNMRLFDNKYDDPAIRNNPVNTIKNLLKETAPEFPDTEKMYDKCSSIMQKEEILFSLHAIMKHVEKHGNLEPLDKLQFYEPSILIIKDIYKKEGLDGIKGMATEQANDIKAEFASLTSQLNKTFDPRKIE